MEFLKELLLKIIAYKGRILGSLAGLMTGLLWVLFGFWKALAFIFCVILGFILGKKIDQRGSLREILNRVLPPND